jgi:hypothetical protein
MFTIPNYGASRRAVPTPLIAPTESGGWTRPADWLPLPEVFPEEQKITALFAVFDHGSNFVAFTISGAYTVDWGDGTVQNFTAGTTAQRNYVYSAIGADTLSTLGYRQAIITITPQAGQNFTSVNLGVKHNQTPLPNGYSAGWLDINMAGQSLTSLTVRDYLGLMQRFNFVGTNLITSFVSFCSNCHALVSLPNLFTAAGTNFNGFLNNCYSLTSLPNLNTAAGTSFSSFLFGCYSLTSLPNLNTAAGTSFHSFLFGCYSLTSLPNLNTAAGTSFHGFCQNCYSLTSLPALNTSAGTNFTSFCGGCYSLTSLPNLNTSAGTNFANFCLGCTALASLPALNTSASTNFNGFLTNCFSLSRCQITGISRTISFVNLKLGGPELVEIFNNLGTVSGQTITISGNWGASLLTTPERAIATGKGWSIVG